MQICKPTPMKFDPKTLQVPPHSAEKILTLGARDVEKHMQVLMDALSASEKGPPSSKRVHLLHYVAVVAGSSATIANLMVRRGMLALLAKLTKDASAVDV